MLSSASLESIRTFQYSTCFRPDPKALAPNAARDLWGVKLGAFGDSVVCHLSFHYAACLRQRNALRKARKTRQFQSLGPGSAYGVVEDDGTSANVSTLSK